MAAGILQASVQNRGLVLDPRTKLMMLFNIALFVLRSAGGESVEPLVPVLCFMPAVLFISAKRWKQAATYLTIYLASWLVYTRLVPLTLGAINFILLGCSGMLSRFLRHGRLSRFHHHSQRVHCCHAADAPERKNHYPTVGHVPFLSHGDGRGSFY